MRLNSRCHCRKVRKGKVVGLKDASLFLSYILYCAVAPSPRSISACKQCLFTPICDVNRVVGQLWLCNIWQKKIKHFGIIWEVETHLKVLKLMLGKVHALLIFVLCFLDNWTTAERGVTDGTTRTLFGAILIKVWDGSSNVNVSHDKDKVIV